MLKVNYPHNGRTDRIRHYSDSDRMILQKETGVLYAEAVDVYPARYTYEETDVPVEPPEEIYQERSEDDDKETA